MFLNTCTYSLLSCWCRKIVHLYMAWYKRNLINKNGTTTSVFIISSWFKIVIRYLVCVAFEINTPHHCWNAS